MEVSKDDYTQILSIIKTINENVDYELEARICGKNFAKNVKMDYYKFESILNSLIFSKEYGGYNFSDYTQETTLDVKTGNNRLTIDDKDSVKMYWLKGELDGDIKYKFIQKEMKKKIDLEDYNVRISVSSEDKLSDKDISKMINDLKNQSVTKTYRLKNRFSINTPENMFRFDLTSIKMADGVSFKKSNVFKQNVEYEIELEYVGKGHSQEDIIQNLFKYTNILLKLYNNTNNIIKTNEINNVLDNYQKLITYSNKYNNDINPLFIVVNPVSLHKINLVENHTPNIIKEYAVTLKADGLRNLLYVLNSTDKKYNGRVYLINNSMNVRYIGIQDENWSGSIIEGEYIETDDKFLAYDMLYERGNDIRNLPLIDDKKSRLGFLDICVKALDKKESGVNIETKTYLYGENIFEKIKELWENKDNFDYKVDGLIFTPMKEGYPKRVGTWDKLLKWKPPEYNSFDFLIRIEKNNKGNDIKSPHIIYKDNGESVIYQYKILNLYVGKLEFNKNSKKRNYTSALFNPTNDKDSTIHQAKIILDRNGKMMAKDPINGKYSEIIDDTIVEFVYNNNEPEFKWNPIRIRHDKTDRYKSGESIYGNNERTANDIWKNVSEPLTFSELSLGSISESEIKDNNSYYACKEYKPTERSPYQNFHNLIVKKSLIKEVAPQEGGRLLDLACGKAGDLNKWANAKYEDVVSIDIDRGCLDYAVEYYESYNKPNKPNVTFIWGDTSKLIFPNYVSALNPEAKIEMKKSIPSKYSFDVVSNQFCLHYYFESDIKLRSLLQNVNDNLKIGGHFIGTCFDGKRVVEELKNKKYIEGKKDDELIWKIEKMYSGAVFNSPRSQYDKNINVYVKSIDVVHKESLVDFDYFDKLLVEYGFEKEKVIEFAEYYDKMNKNNNEGKVSMMGEEEKEFSFLNNAFIYKKVRHTGDNLYKKLVGAIDKTETSGTKKIKIKRM